MKLSWWQRLKSLITCLYKGCDGRTGTHDYCSQCKAYRTDKTSCDIPY